jgi:hypothetical protein
MTGPARNSRELPRPIPQDEAECANCGVRLRRKWQDDGLDFIWVDAAGKFIGGDPPDGFANGYEWLEWLKHNDIGRYSVAAKALDLGTLWPWEHRHVADLPSPYPGKVPFCCGWPMQLVRNGWRCRYRHRDTAVPGTRPTWT